MIQSKGKKKERTTSWFELAERVIGFFGGGGPASTKNLK